MPTSAVDVRRMMNIVPDTDAKRQTKRILSRLQTKTLMKRPENKSLKTKKGQVNKADKEAGKAVKQAKKLKIIPKLRQKAIKKDTDTKAAVDKTKAKKQSVNKDTKKIKSAQEN